MRSPIIPIIGFLLVAALMLFISYDIFVSSYDEFFLNVENELTKAINAIMGIGAGIIGLLMGIGGLLALFTEIEDLLKG